MRRGQFIQAAADAGLDIEGLEHVMVQTWTSILGVERKKLGNGEHRIAEAERLVECEATTFRGLGHAAVDVAEAVLMGGARAYRELGIKAPKPAKVKAPKPATTKARKPRSAA